MCACFVPSAANSHERGDEVQRFAGRARARGQASPNLRHTTDCTTVTAALRWSRRCAATVRTRILRTMLCAATLLLVLAPGSARCQEIWFGPRMPDYTITPVTDWAELFKPTPQWNQLAGQIQVFQGSDGFYRITPDDQLQAIAANAASHHIALAMEIGAITQRPNEPCDKGEGYLSPAIASLVIGKFNRLGIRLQIVRLDGPVWFGHYQKCQLPLAQLVPRVAETLRPFLQAFPDLVVGDVVPPQALAQFPDWQATYLTFKRDLEAAIGRKLAFVHMDVDWRQPDWPTAIAAMQRLAHGAGMKFGVIYNGDSLSPTDQAWVAEAKRHFDELETRYGVIPDQAVFDTWSDYPTRVFPETSDAAHSFLVAQYRLPRTHLSVQRSAAGVQGRLLQAGGQPVPGARIAIVALGDDPNLPPPVRSVAGTVPPQARFAVLALRVNSECWCSGANDLLFGPLSYRETAGGSVRYEFRDTPPRPEPGIAATPEVIGGQALLHLKVAPNRNFGFNSPAFAVTPGARFQFDVPLGSLNGDGLFGSAAVIWLDAQRQGFKRDGIQVGNDAAPIAAAVTDASGNFAAALPEAAHWRQRPLLLDYAGSPSLRAAYASPP
jgi:hypothetical protein